MNYKDIRQLIGKNVTVKIDRALGTMHKGFIYTLNYGYIEGIIAPDGECLDAYVLGVSKPVREFTGRCIAIIHRTDEDDDKVVVAPEGEEYSDEQIKAMTDFQERFHRSVVVRYAGSEVF